MINRIKNLWAISGANVSINDSGEVVLDKKPKKRLAIIVEDTPIDQFPTENPEL